MPTYYKLCEYWEEFPPVHVLVHMIAQGLAGQRISADIGGKSKSSKSTTFKPTPANDIFTGLGRSIEDARRAAANE